MKLLARLFIPFVFLLCVSAAKPAISPMESQGQKNFEEFGKWLSGKFRCVLLKAGSGALVDSQQVAYSLSLADERMLTLELARPLLIAMVQTIERMMEDDPAFESTLKILARRQFAQNTSLIYDHLGIKISFWDKNMERPHYPYVADARFVEGKLYFFYADPYTQALYEPIVETYDVALQRARQPLNKPPEFKTEQVRRR